MNHTKRKIVPSNKTVEIMKTMMAKDIELYQWIVPRFDKFKNFVHKNKAKIEGRWQVMIPVHIANKMCSTKFDIRVSVFLLKWSTRKDTCISIFLFHSAHVKWVTQRDTLLLISRLESVDGRQFDQCRNLIHKKFCFWNVPNFYALKGW